MRKSKSAQAQVIPFPGGRAEKVEVKRIQDGNRLIIEVHHYHHQEPQKRPRFGSWEWLRSMDANRRALWLVVMTIISLAICHL